MQTTTGLRSILSHHAVYSLLRWLTGSEELNQRMVEEHVRPRSGDVLLDVGCGPAAVLRWLPDVAYYGIDLSDDYLRAARARFGQRGTFLRGDIGKLPELEIPPCDIAIAFGVMHHLDDGEVLRALAAIRGRLKPEGRLVTYDPCFTTRQNPFARAVHRLDRGGNVRYPDAMLELFRAVFPDAEATLHTDYCRVPSTVIVLNARRSNDGVNVAPIASCHERPRAA